MAYWLYPANNKYYDVMGAFSKKTAFWPMKSKVTKGDIVLIYLASPFKQIGFKCTVVKTDMMEDDVYDKVSLYFKQIPAKKEKINRFMKLDKIESIPLKQESPLGLNQLRKFGLNGMLMGPRNLDNIPKLLSYISGCIS